MESSCHLSRSAETACIIKKMGDSYCCVLFHSFHKLQFPDFKKFLSLKPRKNSINYLKVYFHTIFTSALKTDTDQEAYCKIVSSRYDNKAVPKKSQHCGCISKASTMTTLTGISMQTGEISLSLTNRCSATGK